MMKRLSVLMLALAGVICIPFLAPIPVAAQTKDSVVAKAKWARDFNGVWSPVGGTDISANLLPGQEISLTPFGAQQYNKIDEGDSPAYDCFTAITIRRFSQRSPRMRRVWKSACAN